MRNRKWCIAAVVVVPLLLAGCEGAPTASDLTGEFDSSTSTAGECSTGKAEATPRPEPGACFNPRIDSISPAFGPPGSRVTIRGSGFGERQRLGKVTFNAIEAIPDFQGIEARPGGDVVSWSPTEIVVKVPDRAANEPDQPAAVVVSCGEARFRELGRARVPFIVYQDSNAGAFDIRRPGSDLDMGFWVFRMGTFGNEHALTDDPINPCDIAMKRCQFQQARACDRNDLDFGKYGVSSSQCAGLGLPWGGEAYNASSAKGLDTDGDGKVDLPGGILQNADYLGLLPEANRDLETGNFPESLLLYGEDVELSDSSGFVGVRRVRDIRDQVRFGVTCAFCHTGESIGGLPTMGGVQEVAPRAAGGGQPHLAAGADVLGPDPSRPTGQEPGTGHMDPVHREADARVLGSGTGPNDPVHREAGADVLGPDPNRPVTHGGGGGPAGPVHREAGAEELGPDPNRPVTHVTVGGEEDGWLEGGWRRVRGWLGWPSPGPGPGAGAGNAPTAASSTAGAASGNTGASGPTPAGVNQATTVSRAPAAQVQASAPPSAPVAAPAPLARAVPAPSSRAAPGPSPQPAPGPAASGGAYDPPPPGVQTVGAGTGAGTAAYPAPGTPPNPFAGAPRPGVNGNIYVDPETGALPRPPDRPAPPPPNAGQMVGRQPGPVENGLANRTLRLGVMFANSRLVAILDDIDPLPGGRSRRQILLEGGPGRFDFHGFPRVPADAGYEAVPVPHHLITTGFTRMLYSDRVDRSPLAEVQRRITQQALFDSRNIGALLNARAYFGVVNRSQETIDAVRALAIYLNATQNPMRVRSLIAKQAASEPGYRADLVKRGKELFNCHGCTKCHAPHLERYTSLAVIPLSHIDTDPRHALARGNHLEGEGEFVPLPVAEAPMRVSLSNLSWVLEVNRILSPRVDPDLRDTFRPLVVKMDLPGLDGLRGQLFSGEELEDGLRVQAKGGRPPVALTGRMEGSRLRFEAGEATLETREGSIQLSRVSLAGVIHPDGSTWGAPLQDNRLSMLSGEVVASTVASIPAGSRFEAYVSGVREDLFGGTRLPVSHLTVGYRVPKLVGLRHKVGYFHDGSLKRLEDLMDPARFKAGYQPPGFERIPPGYDGVPGHQFSLIEDAAEREAILAFLRTL